MTPGDDQAAGDAAQPVRVPVFRQAGRRGATFSRRGFTRRPFGVILAPPGSRVVAERVRPRETNAMRRFALWLPTGYSLGAAEAAAAASEHRYGLSWDEPAGGTDDV